MINSKIIQALEPLNIPIYWMNYDGNDSEYIIFQTNSQNDIRFTDDTADAEQSDIGLIYWFNTPDGVSKIDRLKELTYFMDDGFKKGIKPAQEKMLEVLKKELK